VSSYGRTSNAEESPMSEEKKIKDLPLKEIEEALSKSMSEVMGKKMICSIRKIELDSNTPSITFSFSESFFGDRDLK
jgi:hypothetical protein